MDDTAKNESSLQSDEIYSKAIRAGKRTYFFDVKATRGNDYYLTITESKRTNDGSGAPKYEKHKLFLYKEDFEKFVEGLQDVIAHIQQLNEQSLPADDDTTKSFADVQFEDLHE